MKDQIKRYIRTKESATADILKEDDRYDNYVSSQIAKVKNKATGTVKTTQTEIERTWDQEWSHIFRKRDEGVDNADERKQIYDNITKKNDRGI